MDVKMLEIKILNMDGKPDSDGDIFSPDTIVGITTSKVPLVWHFSDKSENLMGSANIFRKGNGIFVNDIQFIKTMDLNVLKNMYMCVGGLLEARKDHNIKKFKIKEISISPSNADPNIKSIGVQLGKQYGV